MATTMPTSKSKITVYVDDEVKKKLQEKARSRGLTLSSYLAFVATGILQGEGTKDG